MWQDVYIGPGSLYVNGQKVIEDNSGTIVFSADVNQNIDIQTTGSGDIGLTPATGGTIELNGTFQMMAGKNMTSSDGNSISVSNAFTMNGEKVADIATCTANGDAANKLYVDSIGMAMSSDSGTGTITVGSDTLVIAGGTNVNTSMTGDTVTVNLDASPSFTDLTLSGNLTVNGTTTTIDTTNLAVSDAIIQCASGNSGATATYIGLQAERGATDAYMVWEESSDRWRATTSTDGATHSDADMQCGTLYGTASSAQYADLAENYSADADYEAGTVVCFGGDAEVTQCNEDGDRRIAGVVSTDPAYLMNSSLEGTKAAVALQGRVPCKVTGAVQKGDMMVSAGNGMARAEADPKMGSVIGKAIEDFNGGEGVIEVVIGRV
jgi:hypothetical protein